jgi:hypothetical protein
MRSFMLAVSLLMSGLSSAATTTYNLNGVYLTNSPTHPFPGTYLDEMFGQMTLSGADIVHDQFLLNSNAISDYNATFTFDLTPMDGIDEVLQFEMTDGHFYFTNQWDMEFSLLMTEGTTNPGQLTEWRLNINVDSVPGTEYDNVFVLENTATGDTYEQYYGSPHTWNLSSSVVPIPAAVWLFGSALAGLGWFRRRQTA